MITLVFLFTNTPHEKLCKIRLDESLWPLIKYVSILGGREGIKIDRLVRTSSMRLGCPNVLFFYIG